MPGIRTILHPTDLSDSSRHAFQLACNMARDYQARLILFHVIPAPGGCVMPDAAPDPRQSAESQESLKRWHFAWPEPVDSEVRVEHRVAEGDALHEILRMARAEQCDLIVMGTHGRTGLSRLLAGSVAEEVVRKAACPVLAVRAPRPETSADVCAKPGEIVDVRPLGPTLAAAKSRTLARADQLEVVRLIVGAAEDVPERKARGPLVVTCLEGRVTFTALGKAQDLQAGQMLYLPAGEPYSLRGVVSASLLVTTFAPL